MYSEHDEVALQFIGDPQDLLVSPSCRNNLLEFAVGQRFADHLFETGAAHGFVSGTVERDLHWRRVQRIVEELAELYDVENGKLGARRVGK